MARSTKPPSTGWPVAERHVNGGEWTGSRNCWAISGFSSILTLTSRTAPLASLTAFSSPGPSVLHGPHQGAQKSTITGTSRLASSTSAAKVASEESLIKGLAAPSAAAFWAGLEVTGMPPGPIKAMGRFRCWGPRRWGFGRGKGRGFDLTSLPRTQPAASVCMLMYSPSRRFAPKGEAVIAGGVRRHVATARAGA